MYNQDCVTVSIDIQNLIILSRDIHRSESSYVNLPERDCPCRQIQSNSHSQNNPK